MENFIFCEVKENSFVSCMIRFAESDYLKVGPASSNFSINLMRFKPVKLKKTFDVIVGMIKVGFFF